jgi:hypothetical protein
MIVVDLVLGRRKLSRLYSNAWGVDLTALMASDIFLLMMHLEELLQMKNEE